MTTQDILDRADEIDDQNSRMAGLVVAFCIGLCTVSGIALYHAFKLIPL